MENVLKNIPVIYISLKHRTYKKLVFERELRRYGFKNIIHVQGVYEGNSKIGCAKAHLTAVRKIEPPFIVLEEDAKFEYENTTINMPSDTDALYLGVSSWGRRKEVSGPFLKYDKVDDNTYRIYNMLGTHAILYMTPRFVQASVEILKEAIREGSHIDNLYADKLQRSYNVYSLNEPLFYQTSQAFEDTRKPLIEYEIQ